MPVHNNNRDLEERTFEFARDVRLFIKGLEETVANIEDGKQLVRSSGSVAANYREGNEALSQKDRIYRMKISRKEAKESHYWLKVIITTNDIRDPKLAERLLSEAVSLRNILSTIIRRLEGN